ncbi:hypothetical protein [Crocosphaera sp. Alani8]|uniref:hypothetical protein n=1 Tax=Crocosphaera sp. Alani8 TaxID=3038952 RepID=UPI00313D487E
MVQSGESTAERLGFKISDGKSASKKSGSTLAHRIVDCCKSRNYPLRTGTGEINIVAVEGMNVNGSFNNDQANLWNDEIAILVFENGTPKLKCCYLGTTEPGRTVTQNPYRGTTGAARLDTGHHQDLWQVGLHRGYEALAQNSNAARLVRDRNKNYSRDDKVTVETGRGINLHTTKTTGWRGSAGGGLSKIGLPAVS